MRCHAIDVGPRLCSITYYDPGGGSIVQSCVGYLRRNASMRRMFASSDASALSQDDNIMEQDSHKGANNDTQ